MTYGKETTALVVNDFREQIAGMAAPEAVEYLLGLLDFIVNPEPAEIDPLRTQFGLTIHEAKLVLALSRSRGRIVTKETLMGAVYGGVPDDDWPQLKIIDVFVCKIRAKLTDAPFSIETAWGRGYRFNDHSEENANAANG